MFVLWSGSQYQHHGVLARQGLSVDSCLLDLNKREKSVNEIKTIVIQIDKGVRVAHLSRLKHPLSSPPNIWEAMWSFCDMCSSVIRGCVLSCAE